VRVGCIDIGSNTTRLLVADREGRQLVEVHQERAFTHIGRELTTSGTIGSDKIVEVVAVVLAQLAIARDHGAVEVRGVATAAIRGADNGRQLVAAIRAASGLNVEILSGEEEARLAFVGGAAMLDLPPSGELAVIDVGGGSSELVVGTVPDRIRWWASVALGSGALTDRCLSSDPPSAPELTAARVEIAGAMTGLHPPRPALAIAVGGSATSLSRLAGPVLDAATLGRSLDLLGRESSSEIAQRFMIDGQRARLLPAGLLILEAIATLLGATLRVGRGGIREGVLLEALI
jgi:exopolyphosphatase / guanosine-5'-triphosphate,3'-diphosphate pyrophosphatase